jgi:hypothetical protein
MTEKAQQVQNPIHGNYNLFVRKRALGASSLVMILLLTERHRSSLDFSHKNALIA